MWAFAFVEKFFSDSVSLFFVKIESLCAVRGGYLQPADTQKSEKRICAYEDKVGIFHKVFCAVLQQNTFVCADNVPVAAVLNVVVAQDRPYTDKRNG